MNMTSANSLLTAIDKLGGVYILGNYFPIWVVVLVELCFAYTCEMII
ncbi:MAG: hypothetical protein ACI33S_04575 [Bacilli bacterium]